MAKLKRNEDKKGRDEQNTQPDNAELQQKISDKQAPNDTDKGGLNADQRKNMSPAGAMERESVGEIGSDEDRKRKEKNR